MTTIANKLLVCVCCIMVFLLSITSTAAVHLQMVTANYIKMGGCPPDLLPPSDCPRVDQSSCPHHELVKDKCHACKICPKKLDEACGGPYYVYGVCSTDGAIPPRKLYCTKNGQEISQQALMNGVSKTGVCKRKYPYKLFICCMYKDKYRMCNMVNWIHPVIQCHFFFFLPQHEHVAGIVPGKRCIWFVEVMENGDTISVFLHKNLFATKRVLVLP